MKAHSHTLVLSALVYEWIDILVTGILGMDDDRHPLTSLFVCVFVFSRCVIGFTRWQQPRQCCWLTPGSSCSLTRCRRRQGPTSASCCPPNCLLHIERHFRTSSHRQLTSGSRSVFTVSVWGWVCMWSMLWNNMCRLILCVDALQNK